MTGGDSSTLAVVLPNYNHAHVLPRAVRALLAQERQPDEIIIVDDGSTDESLSVIQALAAETPSIRIIVSPSNQGAIAALTRGLEATGSRFVYFAAADDWVMPGFFKQAVDVLAATPEAGLFCGEAVLLDAQANRPFGVRPAIRPVQRARFVEAGETRRLLKRMDNWILTGSAVFRRDHVIEAGGFDACLGSFADGFLARKIALAHGFYFYPKVVAAWVVSPHSFSRTTALNIDHAKHALDVIPGRLAADPSFPSWYPALFEKRWRFASARLALQAPGVDEDLLLAMGTRRKSDARVLRLLCRLPHKPTARYAILAWLWFRLRPSDLLGLLRTALAFRMLRFRSGF